MLFAAAASVLNRAAYLLWLHTEAELEAVTETTLLFLAQKHAQQRSMHHGSALSRVTYSVTLHPQAEQASVPDLNFLAEPASWLTAGYLHGFDKFMNLVLMNVDEDYTVMTRVPHPYTVTIHEPADPQPPPMSVSHPMAGGHSSPCSLCMLCATMMLHITVTDKLIAKTGPHAQSC